MNFINLWTFNGLSTPSKQTWQISHQGLSVVRLSVFINPCSKHLDYGYDTASVALMQSGDMDVFLPLKAVAY